MTGGAGAARLRGCAFRALGARAVVLAVLAIAGAGCGEAPESRADRLAASVQDKVEDEITAGPAYAVLDASCEPRGSRYRCTVDITTTPDAHQEELAVRLRSDGCWVATRSGFGRAAGRELADDELTPRILRGCLDGSG